MKDLNTATFDKVYNLATPEEIIEDARNGRMYILVDAEDRENEGDLIIPCLLYTSPSPRDRQKSRMPSSA